MREPIDSLALSNAVRPGVVGWMKTLAREVGPEAITVNTIAPGRIDTERLREVYPDGAVGRRPRRDPAPRASAHRARSRTSSRSSPPTARRTSPGTVVPVDGGSRAPPLKCSASCGRSACSSAGALLLALVTLRSSGSSRPNDYLFLPDKAHAGRTARRRQGGQRPTGRRRHLLRRRLRPAARALEQLFHGVHQGETLVHGTSSTRRASARRKRRHPRSAGMARSQEIAAAVALNHLG